ncbi:hypothetical protein Bca4012_062662 [Brassica carinata]|uniref:Uncharacterized protein n=1 Tax=Brassica carinata TaxID=52824 RepID=A0A8X7U9X2_BRACI|nr:hypothetical protein Bca52824_064196 [Brassica carinata]
MQTIGNSQEMCYESITPMESWEKRIDAKFEAILRLLDGRTSEEVTKRKVPVEERFVEIPLFYGYDDDLRPWLDWMENRFASEDFTDDQKMAMACGFIRGEAQSCELLLRFGDVDDPELTQFRRKWKLQSPNMMAYPIFYGDDVKLWISMIEHRFLRDNRWNWEKLELAHIFVEGEAKESSRGMLYLYEESPETQNMEDLVQTSTCVKEKLHVNKKKQKYQKGWKFKFKKRSWRRTLFQEKLVDEFSIGFGLGDLFERAELFQHTIDIKVGSLAHQLHDTMFQKVRQEKHKRMHSKIPKSWRFKFKEELLRSIWLSTDFMCWRLRQDLAAAVSTLSQFLFGIVQLCLLSNRDTWRRHKTDSLQPGTALGQCSGLSSEPCVTHEQTIVILVRDHYIFSVKRNFCDWCSAFTFVISLENAKGQTLIRHCGLKKQESSCLLCLTCFLKQWGVTESFQSCLSTLLRNRLAEAETTHSVLIIVWKTIELEVATRLQWLVKTGLVRLLVQMAVPVATITEKETDTLGGYKANRVEAFLVTFKSMQHQFATSQLVVILLSLAVTHFSDEMYDITLQRGT